jgi:hypothetical protein
VLWKRELDRDVIESDRNSELHYAQEQEKGLKQGLSQGTMQATGLSESEIAVL